MKKLLLLTAVIAILCVGGSALYAATDVHTASYVDGLGSNPLSVAQFNPALGTLNSVKIDLSSLFTATLTGYKTVTTLQYITWAIEDPTMTLLAPDSSPLIYHSLGWIELVGTQSGPASGAARIALPQVPPGTIYSQTKSLSGSASQTLFSGLSPYIGAGNAVFSFISEVPSFTLGTLGGNNVVALSTVVSADLTVTYDYTPVPEPSSLIILAGGLSSLLALRRRRA